MELVVWGIPPGALLWKAPVSGALLLKAHVSGALLWKAHVSGALLLKAYVSGALLWEAHLSEALPWKANVSGALLWKRQPFRSFTLKDPFLRSFTLKSPCFCHVCRPLQQVVRSVQRVYKALLSPPGLLCWKCWLGFVLWMLRMELKFETLNWTFQMILFLACLCWHRSRAWK